MWLLGYPDSLLGNNHTQSKHFMNKPDQQTFDSTLGPDVFYLKDRKDGPPDSVPFLG